MALCGSCTVHVDGQATRSCTLPIGTAKNHKITTIEGMENDRVGRVVQAAWTELGVAQCGYCQAGQIMSAVALLNQKPRPTDDDIDSAMTGNICRCATYMRIRQAIHKAANATTTNTQAARGEK
jgi:isoquinoline 1-oxidoreductase alpha subunit